MSNKKHCQARSVNTLSVTVPRCARARCARLIGDKLERVKRIIFEKKKFINFIVKKNKRKISKNKLSNKLLKNKRKICQKKKEN